MKVTVYSKEHANSGNFNEMMEEKMSRLDHFFHGETEAKVTLSNTRGNKKVEVTVPNHGMYVRAEHSSDDYYKSMDKVVEKIEGQMRKYKTRMEKRNGDSIRYRNGEEELNLPEGEEDVQDDVNLEFGNIIKVKKFPLKPMVEEEAVLQMEMLGHNFFVFKFYDGKTGVVYKRGDGNYGLIEEE